MKSDVDFTVGFRCWMAAIDTPDLDAITANVSPACTLQNLPPTVFRFFFVVVVDGVVVTTCLRDVVGTDTPGGELLRPDSSPERTSTIAIVAARRNAAGAA
jgi:hypothetical protein